MAPRYRGVLFDLFGTLIAFDVTRLPEVTVDGTRQRLTLGALRSLVVECVPGTSLDDFFRALVTVSDEMARARAYDHLELPSRERFRRALQRVGCDDDILHEAAIRLSRAHMEAIAAATVFPAEHAALLSALRPRYRVGVVTNFDDTATAYDILLRHGIAPALDTVVVSEALGLRKPHPALVRTGLAGLGLAPGEVLFVGDNPVEDVGAARAAGVDVAWIDAAGRGVPEGALPPSYVVRALTEVAAILDPP